MKPTLVARFILFPVLLAGSLIVLSGVVGCSGRNAPGTVPSQGGPVAPTSAPPAEATLHLDHAQTGLSVIKLWVGPEELSTELCLTIPQLSTGMMFRTNLAENAAMLFPFAQPHRASFYMKNTTVPLSAAYIDPDGVIAEIHDLKPLDESSVTAGSDQIQYVLEVNQGWFARHGVTTGAVVRTPQGTLRQTFFRLR